MQVPCTKSRVLWIIGAVAVVGAYFVPNFVLRPNVPARLVFNWQFGSLPLLFSLTALLGVLGSCAIAVISLSGTGIRRAVAVMVLGFLLWLATSMSIGMLCVGERLILLFVRSIAAHLFVLMLGGAVAGCILRINRPEAKAARLLGGYTAAFAMVIFIIGFLSAIIEAGGFATRFSFLPDIGDVVYTVAICSWLVVFVGLVLTLINFCTHRNSKTIARTALWLLVLGVIGAMLFGAWTYAIERKHMDVMCSIVYWGFNVNRRIFCELVHIGRAWTYWAVSISAMYYGLVYIITSRNTVSKTMSAQSNCSNDVSLEVASAGSETVDPILLIEYCPFCGKKMNVSPEVRFCRFCGKELTSHGS